MRELFQVLDREDRISILKLLSLLIKESNKTTYNDNSDWILAFNEAGFRTNDINVNEILSNIDMNVYNAPLEDWQVQALNSICFLENILIFRYVPDNEPKEAIYIQREAETYRKIDKDRPFPLCSLPLMPEEVVRIITLRALKTFGNETNIWFDTENLRITWAKGFDNSYITVNYQTNEFSIWIENSFMQRRFGSDWNTIKEPYRTLFVNEWLKSGTTIVLDELFKGFSSNLNIRYNANVGMGLHILAKLN
ncbi:hypothetical protein [Bacteroides uniformis]|uniref:hypothetical protein n=1 Tax=Bacteroides uniformis TaxID=820 RepID=UPI0039B626C1